jgi:hypothetical protein
MTYKYNINGHVIKDIISAPTLSQICPISPYNHPCLPYTPRCSGESSIESGRGNEKKKISMSEQVIL